jgi:hypothetical protein
MKNRSKTWWLWGRRVLVGVFRLPTACPLVRCNLVLLSWGCYFDITLAMFGCGVLITAPRE